MTYFKFILALFVLIECSNGCEKHRRLAAQRKMDAERMKRQIIAQRAREIRRAQESAIERVRQPLTQYTRRRMVPVPLTGFGASPFGAGGFLQTQGGYYNELSNQGKYD